MKKRIGVTKRRGGRSREVTPSKNRLAQILSQRCLKRECDEFSIVTADGIEDIRKNSRDKWSFRAKVMYYGRYIQNVFVACVTRNNESISISNGDISLSKSNGTKRTKTCISGF